jgi:hypothetical protein
LWLSQPGIQASPFEGRRLMVVGALFQRASHVDHVHQNSFGQQTLAESFSSEAWIANPVDQLILMCKQIKLNVTRIKGSLPDFI